MNNSLSTSYFQIRAYLLILFFSLQSLNSRAQVLVPQEILITAFNKSSSANKEILETKNTEKILPGTSWFLTNANYLDSNPQAKWGINQEDYLKIDVQYTGQTTINKYQFIQYEYYIENDSVVVDVRLQGELVNHLFSIETTFNNINKVEFLKNQESIFVGQGDFYFYPDVGTKLMGTIIDGLFFGPLKDIPLDIAYAYEGITEGLGPLDDAGTLSALICECLDDPLFVNDPGNWTSDQGGGTGQQGPNGDGTLSELYDCECEGDSKLIINEFNCELFVANYIADDGGCHIVNSYEWIQVLSDGSHITVLEVEGVSIPATEIPSFEIPEPGSYLLKIYCDDGDCSIFSNEIMSDCGNEDCEFVVNHSVGECLIMLTVLNCPGDFEVNWFDVTSGTPILLPEFEDQLFVSLSETGCYKYEVTCGNCEPIVSEDICLDCFCKANAMVFMDNVAANFLDCSEENDLTIANFDLDLGAIFHCLCGCDIEIVPVVNS